MVVGQWSNNKHRTTKSLGRKRITSCDSLNKKNILVVQLQAQAGHEIWLQGLGNHCEEASVEYFEIPAVNIIKTPAKGCFVLRKINSGRKIYQTGMKAAHNLRE